MSKSRTICKCLFTFLMILTVILSTFLVTSAYSEVGAAEETASHICDVGAECNYHTEASEDEHSIFLPYAYASRAATSINPDNYPYPTRNLIYSGGPTAQCIGEDVRWLQSVLVHLGYKLDVDGSYGPETRDTIKKFQKKYGLEVDGMSGPITRPKLREIWQKTGHTWDKGTVTKQPEVGVMGTKIYKCIYCEEMKNGFISPLQGPTTPTSKQYIIGDNIFNENIDYYTQHLDSSDYDPTLSNILAALSKAVYNEGEIESAYNSLGFDNCIVSDYNTNDSSRCVSVISTKKSEYNNDLICLITVRGSVSTSDWIGNLKISVTEEGKHLGFSQAMNHIYRDIKLALSNVSSTTNVKYFITGHSRGAAVANLLSVELMEQGVQASNIYNYNYACPDVACRGEFARYYNIFNICNTDDLVPFVPGATCNKFVGDDTSWGKYGQTYWFTKIPEKSGFFKSHAMDLYLQFLNLKDDIKAWPFDIESMKSTVITKIYCPVDAIVTDENGNNVASVINGEITYYNADIGDVVILTSGDKKIVYVHGDAKFNIDLIATDTGTMTYAVESGDLSTGEIYESKTFNNVALEPGKTMHSPVSEADEISDVELFVIEEKDGKKTYTHSINIDGVEELLPKNLWEKIKNLPEKTKKIIVYVVGGVVLLSLLDCLGGRRKTKKKKKAQSNKTN